MPDTKTSAPNFVIIWADVQDWNGPRGAEIRVQLAGTGDMYADYRRSGWGEWTVLTRPMTRTESTDRAGFLFPHPLPVDTSVWAELNTITDNLIGR